MDLIQPFLRITELDKSQWDYPLTKVCTTIGRSPENDISLHHSDEHQYVSRDHCTIEQYMSNFYLRSSALNTPFLRQKEKICQVREPIRLAHKDTFFVQIGFDEAGNPTFLRFEFNDPSGTRPTHGTPYLQFEEDTERLFKVIGGTRLHIDLRPLETRMLRYMFACTRKNNGHPILIPSTDIIRQVWDGQQADGRDNNDLQRLITSVRKKLEPTSEGPSSFLINDWGHGYILITHPVPSLPGDLSEEEEQQ